MTDTRSGKTIGQKYLSRIQSHLARSECLPLPSDGMVNMSSIATATNIPRQSLYKSPSIRSLLADRKDKSEDTLRKDTKLKG
ncbi:hypothetical protein [Orrella marina]|uniref:hypothetical protein n=1 Tax=Orrella marina TaxID=2163011 RepID=UPI00131F2987|nr:hypothetical protein [Orrella marina]